MDLNLERGREGESSFAIFWSQVDGGPLRATVLCLRGHLQLSGGQRILSVTRLIKSINSLRPLSENVVGTSLRE